MNKKKKKKKVMNIIKLKIQWITKSHVTNNEK